MAPITHPTANCLQLEDPGCPCVFLPQCNFRCAEDVRLSQLLCSCTSSTCDVYVCAGNGTPEERVPGEDEYEQLEEDDLEQGDNDVQELDEDEQEMEEDKSFADGDGDDNDGQ